MPRSTACTARAGARSGGTWATASKLVRATAAWVSRTSRVVPPTAASRRSAIAAACPNAGSLRRRLEIGAAPGQRAQLAEADQLALLRIPQLEAGAAQAAEHGQARHVLELGDGLHAGAQAVVRDAAR